MAIQWNSILNNIKKTFILEDINIFSTLNFIFTCVHHIFFSLFKIQNIEYLQSVFFFLTVNKFDKNNIYKQIKRYMKRNAHHFGNSLTLMTFC